MNGSMQMAAKSGLNLITQSGLRVACLGSRTHREVIHSRPDGVMLMQIACHDKMPVRVLPIHGTLERTDCMLAL